MSPLIIKGTETTLAVTLDKANGIFEFSGKSRPENVSEFFEPIFNWFEEYEKQPNQETLVNFKLDYYNSSSAKVLLRLLVRIEELAENGVRSKIHWYYRSNDEDMKESGEDYASLVSVPFEFFMME
ncbi:MAG: nuclear pore complex subunit [Bacteroidetes bacterium HGW-Bacteroidetes-4]|jgi:dimeric dUTPase (all-alpha-NTP-PPase superfamily)|nr:MAG: nuclear pore complex subunit [Bacteroidetes bacterium HGW-Bacteroidetes-4]